MCWCNPSVRTACCGKPACRPPCSCGAPLSLRDVRVAHAASCARWPKVAAREPAAPPFSAPLSVKTETAGIEGFVSEGRMDRVLETVRPKAPPPVEIEPAVIRPRVPQPPRPMADTTFACAEHFYDGCPNCGNPPPAATPAPTRAPAPPPAPTPSPAPSAPPAPAGTIMPLYPGDEPPHLRRPVLPAARSGLAAIAGFTKLSEPQLREIWDEVQENARRLDLCRGHDFSVQLDADKARVRPRWQCRFCEGTVDGTAKLWYERGLAHGRGGLRP